MRICYLNHDLDKDTGAGNFCLALMGAVRKIAPSYQLEVLTSQDALAGGWFRLILNLPQIRSVLRKCDIIHALDGWPYSVIAAIATWRLQKKIIITAIGTGAVKPLYQPIKKWLLIWSYRRADKVVAISRHTRAEILRVVPNLNIEVINHGVDFEKFQITNSKSQTNPKIQNLKPYILSVGALKERKGYEYSIRAFVEIAAKFPELKYVIVGDGPELKNIQLLITDYFSSAKATEDKQLQNRVVILPRVDEEFLISLYHNAELFMLLPQDDNKDIEGFGLVFLEAAACGLPVVATLGTGAADAVRGGYNGLLVPAADSSKAAQAVIRILSTPELRNSFSERSFRFAKMMSWDKVALLCQDIYGYQN